MFDILLTASNVGYTAKLPDATLQEVINRKATLPFEPTRGASSPK